mmetsp:Transcript_54792/g.159848  ORF Transcript_54792/g.159848 Transcript_54792/m.159848 type:complete len:232 (+) Transcript_54792:462-1157(+)
MPLDHEAHLRDPVPLVHLPGDHLGAGHAVVAVGQAAGGREVDAGGGRAVHEDVLLRQEEELGERRVADLHKQRSTQIHERVEEGAGRDYGHVGLLMHPDLQALGHFLEERDVMFAYPLFPPPVVLLEEIENTPDEVGRYSPAEEELADAHLLHLRLYVQSPQLVHRVRDAADEGRERDQGKEHHADCKDSLKPVLGSDVVRGWRKLRHRPMQGHDVNVSCGRVLPCILRQP